MSDQSQGPGWWLASDGRWYPPQPMAADAPPAPPPQMGGPIGAPMGGPMGGPGPVSKGSSSTPLIIGIVVLVVVLIGVGVAFALTRSSSTVIGVPPISTTTAVAPATTAKRAPGTTDSTEPTDSTEKPAKTTTTKKKSSSTTAVPDDSTTSTRRTPRTTVGPNDVDGPVVFKVPADTAGAIAAAGLPELPSEGDIVHYHAHVDVRINGQDVEVAPQIGIGRTTISPVHTHDTTGVVHIESFQDDVFTLGQFFTEWGVDLNHDCLATFCTDADHELRVAVNGTEIDPTDDPADIVFDTHAEIAVWYGPSGETVKFPASYEFTGGL